MNRPKAISRAPCHVHLYCCFLEFSIRAEEGYKNQLWFNFGMNYNKNEKLLLEFDLEPKFQINGLGYWRNMDVSGLAEYYPNDWLDLTGRTHTGHLCVLRGPQHF